jgi:hypothetical protein
MNINCRKCRLSIYQEHIITGNPPIREFRFINYISNDNNGIQRNYSLKILLITFHFKWRYSKRPS